MELIPIAFQLISALASSGIAGTVISGLAGMLGGTQAKDAAKAIVDTAVKTFGTSDPEQIKLLIAKDQAKAEMFAKQLEADTAQYQIQVEDAKDARARDIAIQSVQGGNSRANVMLIGVFASFITIIVGTIYFRSSIPDGVLAILNMSCGGLIAMMTQAFNFEFGSSRGSAEKSALLATK